MVEMGQRSYANLKYKLIKGMRNRAITFHDRAETKEQEEAWDEVISWLNSFLNPKYRITTKAGAIGLKAGMHKIEEVFRLKEDDEELS